jgi:phospholipase D1/2
VSSGVSFSLYPKFWAGIVGGSSGPAKPGATLQERIWEPSPIPEYILSLGSDVISNCTCQIVRSAATWSVGLPEPEQSVYKAYLYAIKRAQHFIYIENQYFISSINRIRPKNRVADALYRRLQKAIRDKEKFRVIILIPVYPAGDLFSATTRYIIKYVYKAVCRQNNSLLEKLQAEFPGENIENYVSFFSLRNYGFLQKDGTGLPVTEQVYIHAKLMIVDDRLAIIGSANINDRSMRGSRDSEICVVLEEKNEDMIDSVMGGAPYKVGRFAHSLRRRLWEEYLGLNSMEADTAQALREKLADPIDDQVYFTEWKALARKNTQVYSKVFHYSLPDNIHTLVDLRRAYKMVQDGTSLASNDKLKLWHERMSQELRQSVRGYLVDFPLQFLKDEQMSPTILNYEFVMPRNVFL